MLFFRIIEDSWRSWLFQNLWFIVDKDMELFSDANGIAIKLRQHS